MLGLILVTIYELHNILIPPADIEGNVYTAVRGHCDATSRCSTCDERGGCIIVISEGVPGVYFRNAGVVGCSAAEATALGFVLLLSTLVCFQQTKLILGFFFHIFSNCIPPPP